jgi:hypothetical protein
MCSTRTAPSHTSCPQTALFLSASPACHPAMQLADSFKSALGGFGASSAAPSSLSGLAGGLSNWWSSLDPPSQPQRNETTDAIQASSKVGIQGGQKWFSYQGSSPQGHPFITIMSSMQATSELQELFGLQPEENLVETFKCRLLQTYGCNHNNFTPAIQV